MKKFEMEIQRIAGNDNSNPLSLFTTTSTLIYIWRWLVVTYHIYMIYSPKFDYIRWHTVGEKTKSLTGQYVLIGHSNGADIRLLSIDCTVDRISD